ncbi:MAG: divergent polysaccharide deacetylase family protein [Cypionkella sp.]|nr:divergent polysaccharide deacetylase family protein [Cypionkella sp.]
MSAPTAAAVDPAAQTTAPEAVTPQAVVPEPAPALPEEAPAAAPEPEPETAPGTDVPLAVTEAPDAPLAPPGSGDAPRAPAPSDTVAAQRPAEDLAAPQGDAPATPAPTPAEPPASPVTDAPEGQAVAAPGAAPVPPGTGDAPLAVPAPDAPGLPGDEPAPAMAELPPPPPLTPEEEALLLPLAPEPEPEPAANPAAAAPLPDPTPEPVAPPELAETPPAPDAAADAPEAAATLAPAPELDSDVPGVVTGRLPRIGDTPAATDEAATTQTADQPVAEPADLPPMQRYARPFDNPAQKPLFSILLVDDGQEGVNRAELAALEMPLSIVIDPLSEGAAERAALWRAGGQEVVMAGTGIPQGASPGDLEQSFQVLDSRLPEAVAVIDADGTAFQNDRPLAAQVVPILAAQGRGLVTFDQGLNAADQEARRAGLRSARIFRRLDTEGEDSPVIRRYLDRAAFKAAQEGRVVVIGTLRPETITGIMEWTIEGRASTVALAPITALLAAN